MSALSDIKREAQPSVLYLIKHELRVFWIASKTIHFIPILSLCLRKNFEYRCCISRENRGKSFVKIYVCFITYKDSFTAMIFFVFCSWIINAFLKDCLHVPSLPDKIRDGVILIYWNKSQSNSLSLFISSRYHYSFLTHSYHYSFLTHSYHFSCSSICKLN